MSRYALIKNNVVTNTIECSDFEILTVAGWSGSEFVKMSEIPTEKTARAQIGDTTAKIGVSQIDLDTAMNQAEILAE